MNIDERLDRLTERHEALTQSVELLAHLHREHEEAIIRSQSMFEKNQVLMAQVVESIDSLARIAHSHERRISNLERDQPS